MKLDTMKYLFVALWSICLFGSVLMSAFSSDYQFWKEVSYFLAICGGMAVVSLGQIK